MFCKKLNKIFFIAIVNLFVAGIYVKAQIQVNEKEFLQMNNTVIQEKIFAHTDKSFYLAGEILWFKLSTVSTDSLMPLDLSKVAYVEILNAQQKPVLQATVSLNDGDGSGSFYLPSSITSGNYIFRAYTNWMKNFGADNYFQKLITIVNTLTPLTKPAGNDSGNYQIDFFPEGGHLVNNIQSKVGFKVVNKYGSGVNCTGNIADENNNIITSFATFKFGIGSFYFTPEKNHTYTAVLKINGVSFKQSLPAVDDKGYVMHVSHNSGEFTINVQTNSDIQKPVYLLAYSNQLQKAFVQTIDASGNAKFIISKNQLGEGITHFTVLNAEKQSECDQAVFIKPSSVQLNIHTDNKMYATRSAVNLAITPVSASADLSVAVYLIDSLQTTDYDDAVTYATFTSALKGNIESPQYYLNNTGNEADSALDNLLLTQSSYQWQNDKTGPDNFSYAPEHEGHLIAGKVFDKNSGLPAAHVRVYLSVPGVLFKFSSAVSNESGNVFFDIKDAYGSNELVVQTSKEDSMYRVEIADPFSNETSSWKVPDINLTPSDVQQLSQHNLAMQIQNAYTINQLNTFSYPVLDSNAFYGAPDGKYYLDNYTRFNTMEEVLREYVSGLDVRIRQGNYALRAVDINHQKFFENNPLVLVDGVPIFDMNKVIAYDPLKIKKAEVVNRKYSLNSLTMNGILSYSTYKGDLNGFPFEPGTIELSYDGLQLQRKFYAPQYTTAQQQQSRLPDYRTTLFWSPQLPDRDTQLSFYTSDIKGKYVAVVQGITSDGKVCFGTTEFTVK